jgi:NAD(P)-dependent dehydrogenase (short-subunit alcohol dehydrogenase family)
MATLAGQVAWITGGGSGIGLAGAVELAGAGATVVLSGRRPAVLEKAAEQVRKAGGDADAMSLNVADALAVDRVASGILERHGRLDILVNSAGLNVAKRSWGDVTAESWDMVSADIITGTF